MLQALASYTRKHTFSSKIYFEIGPKCYNEIDFCNSRKVNKHENGKKAEPSPQVDESVR
jgi:hypothetical protein